MFDLTRLAAESFVHAVLFRQTIESTNTLALQRSLDRCQPTPLLVLTEEQTAGRGRGSNRWWSDSGALTFSLVLDAESTARRPELWPRASLTAAVAVCDVLEQIAPDVPTGIRWPNDVDLAARKICGILPELSPIAHSTDRPRLVLGIGINLNNTLQSAPHEIRAVGTSLCDVIGQRHDPTDFLLRVLQRLAARLEALAQDDPALAADWSRRCLLRGRTVTLIAGPQQVRGTCRGIDRDGALVLHTPAGTQRCLSGRVELDPPL